MKQIKTLSLVVVVAAVFFISGCNSSSSDSSDSGGGTQNPTDMTTQQKQVAGYAVDSANASTEIALNSAASATEQLSTSQSVYSRTPQAAVSEEIDYTYDSDSDGYNDLNIKGTVSAATGTNPKMSITADIIAKYIKDAVYQDEQINYTIKTDSSLSQIFTNNVTSLTDFSTTGNATTTLSNFKMEWTEDSSSISSESAGTITLTYTGTMNHTSKAYDVAGTVIMDLTTTVVIDGVSNSVKVSGNGQFTLENNNYNITGSYTVTINGVQFGPYSLEEFN